MWWQWLIFALLLIVVPLGLGSLAVWIKKKNKLTKEQERVMYINLAKYMLFYWLCDLFYMSFIIDSVVCKYVFGGSIMLIIFYNLSCSVINQSSHKRHGIIRFGIIQDFVVGVGVEDQPAARFGRFKAGGEQIAGDGPEFHGKSLLK